MSDAPSIYTLVVAMARHMVAGCPICLGNGEWMAVDFTSPSPAKVPTKCQRCSELLTLLKQVEP